MGWYGIAVVFLWLLVLAASLVPVWLRQQDDARAEESIREWLGLSEGSAPADCLCLGVDVCSTCDDQAGA